MARHRSVSGIGILLASATLCLGPLMAPAATIEVVLVQGDPLPDGPGTLWLVAAAPTMGDSGQLALPTVLTTSVATSPDAAIYRGGGGTPLTSVVRTGQDLNGEIFANRSLAAPAINARGQVAFQATPLLPTTRALYLYDDALGLQRLAGPGDPLPGAGGGSILNVLGTVLNNSGQVVATANLVGRGNAFLLADAATGTFEVIARTGQSAPNGPGTFENVGSADLNDAGQVAFFYNVVEGGIFTDQLILRSDPMTPSRDLFEIVRTGEPAPGSSGAFASLGSTPSMNASAQVALTAVLDVDADGVSGNDRGFYFYDDATGLEPMLMADSPLPGGDGDFRWARDRWEMNDAGQIAVIADLSNTTAARDRAILRFDRNERLIIAREGDPAPGGDGFFFDFDAPASRGEGIAFRADLLGVTGFGNGLSSAIYSYSDATGLTEVIRRGAPLLGGTVLAVDFFPPISGRSGLNAQGQVAFHFVLTDGLQGVAIWTPGQEPNIAITSPAPDAILALDQILVEGIASDDGQIASVTVNGVPAQLVSTGNSADPSEVLFSALVPLSVGTNTLVAVATDDDAESNTASIDIEYVPSPTPIDCDTNGDQIVDRTDIAAIFADRGSAATGPDDPRDINRDGVISINDGRLCVLECSYSRCATAAP